MHTCVDGMQILKPDESSLSIYCDTFVLDIVLVGGEVWCVYLF